MSELKDFLMIWRVIDDNPPKDSTEVLLYLPEDVSQPRTVGYWCKRDNSWVVTDTQCGGTVECDPTHWMPLPEAPLPARREYTAEERTVRGLDEWRDNPEKLIADLIARIRMLEDAVTQLQLKGITKGD